MQEGEFLRVEMRVLLKLPPQWPTKHIFITQASQPTHGQMDERNGACMHKHTRNPAAGQLHPVQEGELGALQHQGVLETPGDPGWGVRDSP